MSGLFGSVQPRDLTLGTAIEAAFRSLAKPAFIGPLLVISVLLNAILELTLTPLIARSISLSPDGRPTIEDINAFVGGAALTFVVTIIGSTIAAVYGTVWAVAASIGPFPTIGETLRLAGRRWAGVLGASLLVGLIMIGVFAVGAVIVVLLAQTSAALAFGAGVALLIAFLWLAARLYMAPWLAADGVGAVASLRGSWRITEGVVLRVIGWTLAYGFLFALLAGALGLVLSRVPYVGNGVSQGLTLALGYAAGVTLYRRTQAGAAPPPAQEVVPPVTDTTIG
jgi:hypothetical protein